MNEPAGRSQSKYLYGNFLLGLLLFVHMVVILLFFDPKMHIGGDDSDYIIAAHDFWDGLRFPAWHGSFYPIFLSVFVPLFHFDIIAYKVISIVLMVLHFVLFYQAFKIRLPRPVLVFALVITSLNWQLAYYASTTYSEVLFMFLEAAFFYVFLRIEDNKERKAGRSLLFSWALAGFIIFLLSITRNVGIGMLMALVLYLAIYGRWKNLFWVVGFFLFFQALFILYKDLYWHFKGTGMEGELKRIAYKDFYDPTKGSEDIAGFAKRFWINSLGYLSNHLAIILGFRKEGTMVALPWLTVLMYVVFLYNAFLSYRKNKTVFLISIYVSVMVSVTFITLQPEWYQERLILVYLPFIAIILGFFLYQSTTGKGKLILVTGQGALVILPLLVAFRMIQKPKSIEVSIQNLSAHRNKYKGYEDEWKNYSELSEWVGRNIRFSDRVLCRKPGISTIYGQRPFTGISSFHYTVADSAVSFIEKRKIEYILLDQLSLPTVQRLVGYYVQKKPLGLKVVHEIGQTKTARLLRVCHDDPVDDQDHLDRLLTGIKATPNSPYFYVLTGDKLVSMNKSTEAIAYYEQGLSLAPKDDQIIVRRGWAYLQAGNYRKSYDDIALAVKEHPENKQYAELLNEVRKKL